MDYEKVESDVGYNKDWIGDQLGMEGHALTNWAISTFTNYYMWPNSLSLHNLWGGPKGLFFAS